MAQIAMIAGLGMMCLSSSVGAALMMGGGEEDDGGANGGANNNQDDGPACQDDQTFAGQTGTFTCESLDDFKPEGATWWGSWINNSVPVSSEEATTQGYSHTFHELSSSPTEKKYIALRKTDKHCKMVQFDITKSGNTCSYAINDAGYSGMDGGGTSGTPCTATTDAEVIAQWNAKNAVPTARTVATDTGYGLKSLDYSMYC
jgi:hypothetical protein